MTLNFRFEKERCSKRSLVCCQSAAEINQKEKAVLRGEEKTEEEERVMTFYINVCQGLVCYTWKLGLCI